MDTFKSTTISRKIASKKRRRLRSLPKVFAQVQALVGGAPQQVANRDKPTTLIQHIARVRITEASDYDDKTKVYEVLAARACMRLIHKNESAYKNRIGEEPDGLISYVYPPAKVPLPDPAGIAKAFKIGTVSIPVRASKARGGVYGGTHRGGIG